MGIFRRMAPIFPSHASSSSISRIKWPAERINRLRLMGSVMCDDLDFSCCWRRRPNGEALSWPDSAESSDGGACVQEGKVSTLSVWFSVLTRKSFVPQATWEFFSKERA